jgi:hypothetical protein
VTIVLVKSSVETTVNALQQFHAPVRKCSKPAGNRKYSPGAPDRERSAKPAQVAPRLVVFNQGESRLFISDQAPEQIAL